MAHDVVRKYAHFISKKKMLICCYGLIFVRSWEFSEISFFSARDMVELWLLSCLVALREE
jgi:hypothetical protein